MGRDVWMADRFWFTVQGENPQRFLNAAVSQRIHLAHLRWIEGGLTAQGLGLDHDRLQKLAADGGWKFSVLKRRGPGLLAKRLLARPGVLAGMILFAVLLRGMEFFVWTIQFGDLTGESRQRMRSLLAECGICEGAVLDQETLALAQAKALQQSEWFGWVSLNFAGGCLSIEKTDAQYQTVREEAPLRPLVAKAAGQIVAVEAESGFAVVGPRQAVEQGQLLVDVVRLDRDGKEIRQGASGRILARCEKTYTAFQSYTVSGKVLNGDKQEADAVYLFGGVWQKGDLDETAAGVVQTDWQPIQIGRLSLPGCICRRVLWQQAEQTLSYTKEQAEALAKRSCRAELYREFPDAQIEAQLCEVTQNEEGITCTISYRFCANIAAAQS